MSSNIMLFFSEVANCIVSILYEHGKENAYTYGVYFNRTQTSYTSTGENGQSLECFCIIEIRL